METKKSTETKKSNALFLGKNFEHKRATGHALFSPSSMSIWNSCPKAFWIVRSKKIKKPDYMVDLAKRGTRLHKEVEDIWNRNISERSASKQAQFMFNQVRDIHFWKSNFVFIGTEVTMKSSLVEGLEGTSDLVAVERNKFNELILYVIDFKSSDRFQYKALGNLQLLSYALLLAERGGYENFTLESRIIQPNCFAIATVNTSLKSLSNMIQQIKNNIIENKKPYDPKCDNPFCPYHGIK